eukprot:2636782-Amphidinium_carterae.1
MENFALHAVVGETTLRVQERSAWGNDAESTGKKLCRLTCSLEGCNCFGADSISLSMLHPSHKCRLASSNSHCPSNYNCAPQLAIEVHDLFLLGEGSFDLVARACATSKFSLLLMPGKSRPAT